MPEYAGICMNIPKSVRMVFVLRVLIVIPFLHEFVVTYFNKVYCLKEHEAIFLKRQNFYILIL